MSKNLKYQSINLTPVFGGFSLPASNLSLRSDCDFIEGFTVDFDVADPLLIYTLKIDGVDIYTATKDNGQFQCLPLGIFLPGKSIPLKDKFTPLNIPYKTGKIELQFIGASSYCNITFKLRKEENKELYFKDYCRYEVFNLTGTSAEITKFDFRSRVGGKKLVGAYFFYGKTSSNPGLCAKLGLEINSKKSNPINIPIIGNILFTEPKKKFEFLKLDEEIIRSTNINGYLQGYGLTGYPEFSGYLVLKYKM